MGTAKANFFCLLMNVASAEKKHVLFDKNIKLKTACTPPEQCLVQCFNETTFSNVVEYILCSKGKKTRYFSVCLYAYIHTSTSI